MNNYYNRIFGEALTEELRYAKITSEEMAAHIQVTPEHMQLLLDGKMEPTLQQLFVMAEKLEVSLDKLTGFQGWIAFQFAIRREYKGNKKN